MEKKPISLTPAEWQVMEPLWESPRTLMELAGILKENVGWAKSTVSTMVTRMEAKHFIVHTSLGRAKLFQPAFTKEEAAVDETNTLLNRAYQGSMGLLVSTMIRQNSLSKEDIAELYSILDEAGGKDD